MGTIPTTPTFTAGAVLAAADLNALSTAIDFWANPPRCQATRATDQSISTATWTVLSLTGENYDTDSMHDTASNQSRVVAQTAGIYAIQAQIQWANNSSGYRVAATRINAAGNIASGTALNTIYMNAGSNRVTIAMNTVEVSLDVGDYVELFGWQNSGGNLNAEADFTWLSARLVSSI